MNLPVMIGGERPPSPECPSCGRPMVYVSSQHRYQCFKCIQTREEREPLPWWVWYFIVLIAILILILIFLMEPHIVGTGNMTQSTEDLNDDTAIWWAILGVFVVAPIVAHFLERGRERCPACGEVLRLVREVQKYKCLHCGAWYPREDIEVEVVE